MNLNTLFMSTENRHVNVLSETTIRVPGRVHDARAERSKHNNEGMEGREVWGAAARL